MDFYQRQAVARRQSRWLVLALALSIIAVVAALDVVLLFVMGAADPDNAAQMPPGARLQIIVLSSLLWLAIILGASAFKGLMLRGGGGVVARSLGGVRVERASADPLRRRLLNVVEEMSIASGVAVPEVYVLENESAINAFAAGDTPANAAIAVTDGTLQRLNREQLQGVIAHEYSHILNGDMRLNLRLMGWLFGLLVIGLAGRGILRLMPRGRNNKNVAPVLAIAVAMLVLGYLGLFLGRIIQAAVSRNRERLADASAVQFTRNPDGLKNALLKIAGVPEHGRLIANDGEQVAHMLFAPGVQRLFATHPPLGERIVALDPGFDLDTLPRAAAQAIQQGPGLAEPGANPAMDAGTIVAVAPGAVAASVGNPQDAHVTHARALRRELRDLLAGARTSWTNARAALLAMLLADDPGVRARQLELISGSAGADLPAAVDAVSSALKKLPPMLRLPAVQLLFSTLRSAPQLERERLLALVESLIQVDGQTEVFEFCLGNLLATNLRDLRSGAGAAGNLTLADCSDELGIVFAVLARHGCDSPADARHSYETGLSRLLPRDRPAMAIASDWPVQMAGALDRLSGLKPAAKEMLVAALVVSISNDNRLTVSEAELLRTICGRLHCPLPPILPAPAADARDS